MSVYPGPYRSPACLRCGSDSCEHAMVQLLAEAEALCERLGTSLEHELSILRPVLAEPGVDKHAAKSDNEARETRSSTKP